MLDARFCVYYKPNVPISMPSLLWSLAQVIKNSGAKSTSIQVKQTEDGLHLADSILWFDSWSSGELSFLSTATPVSNPKCPQLIATTETIRILEALRKKPTALVCQYNRPFSIGRLRMELLPSGTVLGGASLFVETDNGRILYAPHLLPQRIPTVRQMQLKKAELLILAPSHPDPKLTLPNRKKEKDRLLETVLSMTKHGVYPLIFCEPIGTAQELTKLLSEHGIPVCVHDFIAKVNKVYEDLGSKLGAYTRYSKRYSKQKVALFPLPKKNSGTHSSRNRSDAPTIYVLTASTVNESPLSSDRESDRFILRTSFDGPETKEIITAVNPKEVCILGPFAKAYVAEFGGLGPQIKPLFINDQPTLF